jgi:pSer/pThr/pTyr-binding forkhead associated (FHA) protein
MRAENEMKHSHMVKNLASGEAFLITEAGLMIGRDEDCEITLKDPDVSRKHALLKIHDGKPVLNDNASTNGTLLNKWRIRGVEPLNHGDIITIAEFSFVVISAEPEAK